MKKVMTLLKVAVVIFTLFVVITVGTFAYYEYYGKYSSIININGTIKLDAFDVLYPALREDHTYGVTPENPYVIDNVARLQNLIQLNNAGKLKKYKNTLGVDKFYFCLEFDSQDIPQVLNLLNEGLFDPIGNNEYPFEDELAGIVYGYELTSGNIVYLSGCLPQVELKIVDGNVEVNGVVDTSVNAADYTDGTYLKADFMYNASTFVPNDPESIVFDHTTGTKYIKLEDVTPIHQVIANETVAASTDLVDIGFVSKIATNGYVHDIILYNTSISCNEDVKGDTHSALKELFATLTGHHFADADNHSDERHIGIFAGHIDGAASNISVAGTSTVNINTPEVNYYSNYMTVGYIYDYATIGGVTFSELSQDSFLDGGSVSGCLFADDIYAAVANDAQATTADGATHYILANISASTEHNWPGVDGANGRFSYGSFVFLLSSNDDTVSKIWSGDNAYKLLNDQNYTITGSVLFCADEYRYSPDQQAGGSIIPSSASVKEMLFSGISSLKATGSVIDAGKYLIVAKVIDETRSTGYAYYAIKLKASDDGTGNPVYSMDNTSTADVTEFITDTTGTISLYQSALWNVGVASTTPEFENCRYDDVWLTRNQTTLSYGAYNNNQDNYKLQYSAGNNHLYFNQTNGETTTQYYVSFNKNTLSWSMTDNIENAATIEMYHVADGYYLNLVTSMADIEENGDYVIVARNENNSYLLGIDYTDGVVSNKFASTDKQYLTSEFPEFIELSEYEAMRNYVWNVQTVNNANASFLDKASLTYYLTTNEGALSLSVDEAYWTYNQLTNGGSLVNNAKYLSFTYDSLNSSTTNFTTSNNAYNLYLYRLVPQDDTPLYMTYEGARYLDADSSPIDAGDYAIIGVNGNNYYALGISNANNNYNLVNTTTNVTGTSSLTDYYKWRVSASSSTPSFYNVGKSRYLYHNGTTLNSNSTSATWMYDAQEHRVYYKDGDTTYYLVTNNNGAFSLQSSLDVAGYSYDVRLYKCKTQYTFGGVSIATSFSTNYYYFVSQYNLSNASSAQYLVGYKQATDGQSIDYIEMTNKYDVPSNATITSSSSETLTTTENIRNYVWRYRNNGTYGFLYNYGYYQDNNNNYIYMGASSSGGNRLLIITTSYTGGSSNSENSGFETTVVEDSTIYDGIRIGFRGSRNRYCLTAKSVAKAVDISKVYGNQSMANLYTDAKFSEQDDIYPVYIYQATSMTPGAVLEEVSSDGDSLEPDIHYTIAAEAMQSGIKQYYALAMNVDDNNNVSFDGENVTSQVEMIMNYGNAGYKGSINVPTNADWTQKSDDYKLRFYHTATSSTAEQNYISRSGSNLVMDKRSSTENYDTVSQFYYDTVNKVMRLDIDSTAYYLTYNVSTNKFGLSTSFSDAAKIHLIRYTPTYKVQLVTDFDDDSLKNGNFIIAGHSANGYTAIGSDGSDLDLSFPITSYLQDELSESDYNQIFEYLFKQYYYDYNTTSTPRDYDADSAQNFVILQLYSLEGGSFAPSGSNFETYASPFMWKATRTADGLWKLVNNERVSGTAAGSRGLTFSGSGSSSLKLNDLVPQVGSYIGQYAITTSFSNSTNNIYVYSPSTGERHTQAITNNSEYLLVAEANGLKFIIGNNNGSIFVTRFDDSDVSNFNNNSSYLWTINAYEEGYSIVNNGYYAYTNSTGTLLANNSSLDGCFIINNGAIAYRQYTYYYAYSNNTNSLAVSQDSTYWTKLCRYVIDGTTCKFYPVTDSQIDTYRNELVLVTKNGSNYYLLNIGGANISRSAALTNNTDYYQIALSNIILDEYMVEVVDGANDYEYSIKAANTFYAYSNDTNTLTVSTNKTYWTKICRYVLEDGNYKFYPVTSASDISTYASELVLVSKNVNSYYLINIGTSTISRSATLTNNTTYYQIAQSSIIIDEYLIEANAGASEGQYSIRARNTLYVYSNNTNTLALSSNSSYWTKLYTYTLSGDNYVFSPVLTSQINANSGKLVLISRNGSNYYLLDLGGATLTRSASLTPSDFNFTISKNSIYIEDYLVEVTNSTGDTYTIRAPIKYKPYRTGGSEMTPTTNATYWTKLFTFTGSATTNTTHTYTEITDPSQYTNSTNKVLISYNGTNYYVVRIRNDRLTLTSVGNSLTSNTRVNLSNYLVTVTEQNGKYSFRNNNSGYYLSVTQSQVTYTGTATYLCYSNTYGIYAKGTNYNYLSVNASSATISTSSSTVSYNDNNGVYYVSPYYYLTVNSTGATNTTTSTNVTYSFDNGVYYKNNYYYLTASNTSAGRSTSASTITYKEARGVYTMVSTNYNSSVTCDTFFSSESAEENGAMVVIYKYANNEYTLATDGLTIGEQYVIAIKGNDDYYSLIGYDSANGVLRLTTVGTTLTGFESLVNATHYVDAYSYGSGYIGISLRFHNDNTKYLSINNGNFGVSNTASYWEYNYDPIYTNESRLYTVTGRSVTKTLTVNGNRVVPQASGAETQLFSYTGSGTEADPYKISSVVNANLTNGRSYVIVIYQDGKYYIVTNNDGEIVPVSAGSGFPSTISANMLWTYSSSNYFKPYGETGNLYLRTGQNGALALVDDYDGSSWTYTYTSGSSGSFGITSTVNSATPLYIFKVSMNDSLDAISDTYTTLKGKSMVSASLSVLSSSNYVITASYDGRVYALAMKNAQESTSLDITETFAEASSGGYIRLFASSVWDQQGTDYNLLFNSLGFRVDGVNLLSGSRENIFEGSPTVVQMENMPDDMEPYVWTLYTYGNNDYVLGNYDSGQEDTSFIYFDYTDLMFKVTQNETLAKTAGNKVSIYQLGAEVAGSDHLEYQTFMIDMMDDGVTIKSYPLAETNAEDIITYSSTINPGETVTSVISGEYLIAAKIDEKYYALTLDYSGNLSMSDISLLFTGNFSQDEQGKYCISINTRYLWKQTGTPVYDASTGVASGLTFANYAKGTNLDLDGVTLSYGNGQLYSATKYLTFNGKKFDISDNQSAIQIILYSVGAGSVVVGDDSQELSYSYYSSALNTAAVDFSDFAFKKMQIPDLVTYAKDEHGSLTTTTGWNLTSTTYLETVTSSVYFKDGIAYSTNIDTFASEFSQIESSFNITDEETQEVSTFTVNYYAPKGVVAFVIPDASSDMPTFINIIASTQQDEAYSSDVARYLAIWKMADLENNTLVPITTANGGASDYAATLINKFYKPDNAIPLPNHTGSVASGASYVKVEDGENNYLDYNLSTDANHNHLIGHTFCITSPGVYYIGSTYGTVTISYLSIGNMIAAEEGEVNENVIDSGFSIDFVWGEVPSSATGVDFGDDEGVGSITYVNRLTENDESRTWVHSNIYPKFINGTAGLYEDTKPDDYNPTDYLVITVRRDYTTSESTEYSTVHINASTTLAIANEGEGIIYSNANNAYQRVKRKVELHVTCIDAEEEEEPSGD